MRMKRPVMMQNEDEVEGNPRDDETEGEVRDIE
jgi:hypothetical protein